MAFLRTPGTERLYSGVTKMTASAGFDLVAEGDPGLGRGGFEVLIEEGEVGDLDDVELKGGRGEWDEGVGDFAVEGVFAEAADEEGDGVGHGGGSLENRERMGR